MPTVTLSTRLSAIAYNSPDAPTAANTWTNLSNMILAGQYAEGFNPANYPTSSSSGPPAGDAITNASPGPREIYASGLVNKVPTNATLTAIRVYADHGELQANLPSGTPQALHVSAVTVNVQKSTVSGGQRIVTGSTSLGTRVLLGSVNLGTFPGGLTVAEVNASTFGLDIVAAYYQIGYNTTPGNAATNVASFRGQLIRLGALELEIDYTVPTVLPSGQGRIPNPISRGVRN